MRRHPIGVMIRPMDGLTICPPADACQPLPRIARLHAIGVSDEPPARDRRGHVRRQGGALRHGPEPVKEARREKPLTHPKPGWVEQDPEVIVDAVVERGRRAARGRARDRGLRPRPPGRVGARLGRGERPPADPGRHLAGQALPGGPRPARVGGPRRRDPRASGMPLDPYFSAGKLAWLLEHDDEVAKAVEAGRRGWGRSTRSSATGWAPASRPTPRPRRARSSARPSGTPRCSRSSACRASRCPRSWTRRGTWARSATTPGPSSCRCGRASSTSRRRSPAPAASSPGG